MIGVKSAIGFKTDQRRIFARHLGIGRLALSSSDPDTTPLPQAFIHPKHIRSLRVARAVSGQPETLRQERQQQQPGQKLGPSKTFAGEKSAHLGEPSVLPWRGTVPEIAMDEPNPPSPISTSEPAPPAAPPPVRAIHSVFIGPQGLRPIWRLILYLAMAALTGALLNWLVSSLQTVRGAAGLWVELLNSVILALSVIAPAFVMARIERRRWD